MDYVIGRGCELRIDAGGWKWRQEAFFMELWLRTFRIGEVDDVSVFLEHIDFFNGLDGLDVEFFQRGLELFVIRARAFMDFFHFSSGCAFAT